MVHSGDGAAVSDGGDGRRAAGTGNFKPGMVVQTATVIINIVLAPALMFGWLGTPPMGVAGAGAASFFAIIVGTIWLAVYFFDAASYLKLHPHFKPHAGMWWKVLKIGLPAGVEFAFIAVYLFVVYTVSRPFGAAAQAGFGIGQRIIQAGFMPIVALGFRGCAGRRSELRRPQSRARA